MEDFFPGVVRGMTPAPLGEYMVTFVHAANVVAWFYFNRSGGRMLHIGWVRFDLVAQAGAQEVSALCDSAIILCERDAHASHASLFGLDAREGVAFVEFWTIWEGLLWLPKSRHILHRGSLL